MPRNISFSLTTKQFRNRSKTVTRRIGWKHIKPGDVLMGCEKCQGIKKGELVRLGLIRVVSVRCEPLNVITPSDVVKEGFPDKNVSWFIGMFLKHTGGHSDLEVTRIEFEYI